TGVQFSPPPLKTPLARNRTRRFLFAFGKEIPLPAVTVLGSMTNIRLGLCCIFLEQPIKFRNTTVKAIRGMPREAALAKLSGLCLSNAEALHAALQFCAKRGIGCFRIN